MNKSKRFFVCFFIAIFVMTTVTACGNSGDTVAYIAPENQETVDQNSVESQGEGPVQGGIKSDEEIAALQEEEQQGNTTTEYESNEGHEPESFGSGNFQDYWTGEDYFDLVSYLKDNGAVDAFPSNDRYEKVEDIAYIYVAYTSDYAWRLDIYINGKGSGAILTWMNHMQPPYDQEGPSYFVTIRDPNRAAQGNYRNVTVDEYGNTITDYDLEVISTIIQATQVDQGKDPLANYDNIGYFK